MRTTADHLRDDELVDEPEKDTDRATVSRALGLELGAIPTLLARLHTAVSATVPDYILASDAGEYEPESLFGAWVPSRNPAWR